MKIVLASGNQNKVREIRSILANATGKDYAVYSLSDINFNSEIIEDGMTFEENALIKARAVASLGYIGIGDDSGLAVDALDGAPGIFSARYSGEGATDESNNKKLLSELNDVPDDKRSASFICSIACALPNGEFFTVRGECNGKIIREPLGKGGFGYDPYFVPNGFEKTFSELSFDEKNKISHRANAISKFAEKFEAFIEKNCK